jgi:excisionase family DNA binding protein
MPGLTIAEAAERWGVHRVTVKRWIKRGIVEAIRDNAGMWRITEGQQPPPGHGAALEHPETARDSYGAALERPSNAYVGNGAEPERRAGAAHNGSRAAIPVHIPELAVAQREAAVARREVELLRERLGELVEERDHLRETLRLALDRPSLLERVLRALRGSPASDKRSADEGTTAERAERRA